jgi:hypothetical protein
MRRDGRSSSVKFASGSGRGHRTTGETDVMKRFIIEREIPGASRLSDPELAEIAEKSSTAMASLGVPYRWVNSYVAGDKIYCVHEADDEYVVREHARRCGLPAHTVSVVVTELGPEQAGRVVGQRSQTPCQSNELT